MLPSGRTHCEHNSYFTESKELVKYLFVRLSETDQLYCNGWLSNDFSLELMQFMPQVINTGIIKVNKFKQSDVF